MACLDAGRLPGLCQSLVITSVFIPISAKCMCVVEFLVDPVVC